MTRIQRQLIGEVLVVFGGILAVTTVVVFGGATVQLVVRGEGVGTRLLLELIPNLLPVALSYSLPFAWLAAVALVLGRMVADREITALRSAGLHLRVVAAPVLALAVAVGAVGAAFNAYGVPQAKRAVRAGVRRYVPVFLTHLREVDQTVTLNNGRFSFGRYEDPWFREVELDRRDDRGNLDLKVMAGSLMIDRVAHAPASEGALQFTFQDAYYLKMASSGEPTLTSFEPRYRIQMGRVESVATSVLFNEFFGTRRFVERPKDMTLDDLVYGMARGGIYGGTPARLQESLHEGLALGASPFFMTLFTLAMTLLLPASGRRVRDFLLSFLPPVLLYFTLYVAGPSLARSGTLPPWLAMWSGNLVVAVAGVGLLAAAFRR